MTQIAAEVPEASGASPGRVAAALAQGKLGTIQVAFFMTAALGPLLVSAGTFPSAFAATGLSAVPSAVLIIAGVLALFAFGYLAMARHVVNSGAFYAMVGSGLGRPAGVAAALLALVGYCAMQVSLYGIIGVQVAGYIDDNTHGSWHVDPSWWSCALAVWALVAVLGMMPVKVSATFLGVLSLCEIVVMLVLSVQGLMHPAAGVHAGPFNPARISWRGLGPLSAIVVLCFLGFEQAPVYMEEARDRRRTLLRATALCLGGATVIYALAAWAMDTFYGSNVVSAAQSQGSEMFFAMGPGLASACGNTLFLTSLLAAALAYHNTVARYSFSIARNRLLPAAVAQVRASGVPRVASALQSAIGLAAICATLLFQWNPMTQLFYISSTFGGFTIMALLAATGFAVVAFFWRNSHDENAAVRLWLPAVSALVLTGLVVACAMNLPTMLGVSPSDPTIALLFGLLAVTVLVGVGWSLYLKVSHPDWYERLAGPEPRAARAVLVEGAAL